MSNLILPRGMGGGGVSTGGCVSARSASTSDNYTVCLLHMDGINNGTSFVDETSKTWTANSAAKTSTAYAKFGTAALLTTGTDDRISTPASVDFVFANKNFTIDFWVTAITAYSGIMCGQYLDSNNYWSILSTSGYLMFSYVVSGSTVTQYTSQSKTWSGVGNRYHVAVVRNGNSLIIFQNGTALTLTTNTTISGKSLGAISADMCVGHNYSGAGGWPGAIDEFRVSNGIARWTSNFTPPTAPY